MIKSERQTKEERERGRSNRLLRILLRLLHCSRGCVRKNPAAPGDRFPHCPGLPDSHSGLQNLAPDLYKGHQEENQLFAENYCTMKWSTQELPACRFVTLLPNFSISTRFPSSFSTVSLISEKRSSLCLALENACMMVSDILSSTPSRFSFFMWVAD